MHPELSASIADLVHRLHHARRRAGFFRAMATAAIHQLHDAHQRLRTQQVQIERLRAELRDTRKAAA